MASHRGGGANVVGMPHAHALSSNSPLCLLAPPLLQATVAQLQQCLVAKAAELAAAQSQLEEAAAQAGSAQQALQAKVWACGGGRGAAAFSYPVRNWRRFTAVVNILSSTS